MPEFIETNWVGQYCRSGSARRMGRWRLRMFGFQWASEPRPLTGATTHNIGIMRANLVKYICSIFMLGSMTRASAQSTWDYFISDAGSGSSLVTWSVTGSLATAPGADLLMIESSLAILVKAPGIYADSYVASGVPQSLPTLDGSNIQYTPAGVYEPIASYYTYNAASNGNDSFGLIAPLLPHTGPGTQLRYNPGTQSALLPIDFSDFNPGTYQSQVAGFSTILTVDLTVEPVPEPATMALFAVCSLGTLLFIRRIQTS